MDKAMCETQDTVASWFVAGLIKATSDLWLKGWNERNGGNVTLRLYEEDVAPYLPNWKCQRRLPLGKVLPALAGQYYLVTGSGKYFRNIAIDPEANIGIFRVNDTGDAIDLLWGLSDGAVPTSELSAHLESHETLQCQPGNETRVIMHCHATNLIALSYVLDFNTDNLTRALWEGSTECLVVFPEGVGALEWMVPGTNQIGAATASLIAKHRLVVWQYHGVFGRGASLDEAFGLIDTAEKSSQIIEKIIAMGGVRQTITRENLIDLAQRFNVCPLASALSIDRWKMAAA